MQAQNYSIKAWAEEDRPREKLLSKNPNSLTDSELLAILIGKGSGIKMQWIGQKITASVKNNLNDWAAWRYMPAETEWDRKVKAVVILAALELGRRGGIAAERPVVRDSRQVAGYLRVMLQDQEEVLPLYFLIRPTG
jgi:DNA repair protein RadC